MRISLTVNILKHHCVEIVILCDLAPRKYRPQVCNNQEFHLKRPKDQRFKVISILCTVIIQSCPKAFSNANRRRIVD